MIDGLIQGGIDLKNRLSVYGSAPGDPRGGLTHHEGAMKTKG